MLYRLLGILVFLLASYDQALAFGHFRPRPGHTGFPPPRGLDITLRTPLGCDNFSDCANKIIDGLIIIAIPIVSIMVLVGGFQIMTAAGDPEKFSKGRKTILYSAIGLVVILLAKSVELVIRSIFR